MQQSLPKKDRLTVRASPGIDPQVLHALETVWRHSQGAWRKGDPVFLPPWSAAQGAGPPSAGSVAVLPVFEGESLVAVLYLDQLELAPPILERLMKVSRVLEGGSPDDAPSYLERAGLEELARERLLLFLRRNEWNISRVARILGVTRRTVYLRMRRFAIPRERVAKSAPRPSARVHEDALSMLSEAGPPPRPDPRSRR